MQLANNTLAFIRLRKRAESNARTQTPDRVQKRRAVAHGTDPKPHVYLRILMPTGPWPRQPAQPAQTAALDLRRDARRQSRQKPDGPAAAAERGLNSLQRQGKTPAQLWTCLARMRQLPMGPLHSRRRTGRRWAASGCAGPSSPSPLRAQGLEQW